MWAFLLSKAGLTLVAVMLVVTVIGVQSVRLNITKHELVAAKASLASAQASLKASESLRTAEYAQATNAITDAETTCQARVADALKSATVIRTIVQRPLRVDPKTNCSIRDIVSADELRHAIGAGSPSTSAP